MSYFRQGLGEFTQGQRAAIFDVSPEEIRSLPAEQRISLAFQHLERKTRKHEAFWGTVEGIGTGLIPILTVLGITKLLK